MAKSVDEAEAAYRHHEPRVQAWACWQPQQGTGTGPLAGWPLGIKDIMAVAGMPMQYGDATTAKTLVLKDAPIVAQLRSAGATLLGKTVTTAYAYLDPSITRNPWNGAHTPGGSSSGSAAAVACGMCRAALGSQTAGSLLRPASYCGVAAFKPSFGRYSTEGVFPLAPSLDHVGTMAKTVADLQTLDAVLIGSTGKETVLKRLLIPRQFPGGAWTDAIDDEFLILCKKLKSAGVTLEALQWPPSWQTLPDELRKLLAHEAYKVHQRERFEAVRYPRRIAELIQEGASISVAEAEQVRARQREYRLIVDLWLGDHSAILMPTTTDFAPLLESTGSALGNLLASFAGLPAITLPAGWNAQGLPWGVQLIAAEGSDQAVLGWAESLEALLAIPQRSVPHE
ncbi:MAG: amidase [Gemmataceae bacterium]